MYIKWKKFLEKTGNSNCLENKSAACSQSYGPFVRAVLNQRTTISTKMEDTSRAGRQRGEKLLTGFVGAIHVMALRRCGTLCMASTFFSSLLLGNSCPFC